MAVNFLNKSSKYANIIIYLAIIIVLNVVGIELFKHIRIDLTRTGAYTISKVSEDLVSNLKDPLRIKVFFSENVPAQYAVIERYLRDLMPEYGVNANRNFKYEFYDCTPGKEATSETIKKNIQIAKSFGINELQTQTIEKDEVKVVKCYMGMVIQHGDMIETINPIQTTDGLEYRMTSIIQNMINKISVLQGLKNQVQVKLFLPSDFQIVGPLYGITGLEGVPDKVKAGVEESKKRNYGKVNFVHYSNPNDGNITQVAKNLNLNGLSWQGFKDPNGKVIEAGTGYAALVVENNGKVEVMELLEPRMVLTGSGFQQVYKLKDLDNIDKQINLLIDNLLDINEEVGYLVGKGNLDISKPDNSPLLAQFGQQPTKGGDGANFNKLLSQLYSISEVNVEQINPNTKMLIIAGAKEEFSDYDLFKIDQYVMKGRSLVVFHDGVKEILSENRGPYGQQQPPTYEPNNTGLEKLLAHYGVNIKSTYVYDESAYETEPRTDPYGRIIPKQKIPYAPLINRSQINADMPILDNIRQLIMLKISPLQLDEDKLKENNISFRRVFTSSKEAWEVASINSYNVAPSPDKKGEKALGYVLEGEFKSYFAEQGIPQKEASEESDDEGNVSKIISGDNSFIKQGKRAKILVIGSSETLKNQLIDAGGVGPNAIFPMNLIDYVADRSDWAIMRSKAQQFNPVEPFNEKASVVVKLLTNRQNLKYFNIFGLPLIVGLFGFLVFYKRRHKKKAIQSTFV